jgi:DNA modification methylase
MMRATGPAHLFVRGDARRIPLADSSVHCVVTSPPYYGLRDYGVPGQIGLEKTPAEYVARMVDVFREVRRVLRGDGTLWLNLGDSMSSGGRKSQIEPGSNVGQPGMRNGIPQRPPSIPGLKPKDLIGIPWRVAFALQADGWYLRSDIIWHKPNPMPESVTDRPTKAHEYLFLLSKSPTYYYDADAVAEPSAYPNDDRKSRSKAGDKRMPTAMIAGIRPGSGVYPQRNLRSVLTIVTRPYKGAHFAVMPPALVRPCILAGCPKGGVVFDPFAGAGTTVLVATALGRRGIGLDLSAKYLRMARWRVERPHAPVVRAAAAARGDLPVQLTLFPEDGP